MLPATSADLEQPASDSESARASAPSGKGFAGVFLLTFFLVCLLFLTINWIGNDSGLFPSPLNPAPTERAWKTRRIDEQIERGAPPDVFILGSSRMMQVQPSYLQAITGGTAFNYGVSAGGLIDTLTQLRYLVSRGIRIRAIIFGIDEFAFSNTVSHHKLQLAAHFGLLTHIPFPENASVVGDVLTNISPDSTWDSVRLIFKSPAERHKASTDLPVVLLGDGYLIYKKFTEDKAAGNFDPHESIIANGHRFRSRIRLFKNDEDSPYVIRARQLEMFNEILDLAKSSGADVRVILLPAHPDFEKIAFNRYALTMRSKVSRILGEACKSRGFAYRDFTSLASYNGDPGEFWDGMHQTAENCRRMINVLYGLPPEKVVLKVPTDLELLRNLPAVNSLNTW